MASTLMIVAILWLVCAAVFFEACLRAPTVDEAKDRDAGPTEPPAERATRALSADLA